MKRENDEHPFGDAGQLILFFLFLILWAGDSFFLGKSTFLSKYVPLSVRIVIMSLAMIAALYLGKSGHAVASREDRPGGVVSAGAFRYVRHPLYLACLLFYLGLAVSTASLLSLALLVGIFFFYNHIASFEEKVLESKYREHYVAYKNRTGKWIPKPKAIRSHA